MIEKQEIGCKQGQGSQETGTRKDILEYKPVTTTSSLNAMGDLQVNLVPFAMDLLPPLNQDLQKLKEETQRAEVCQVRQQIDDSRHELQIHSLI